jgi:protein phosphatase 1L
MERAGASTDEIERAMYLAALSQFCIYNPSDIAKPDWPLRDGDPLHRTAMTKQSCTLTDFHRALRARDPLGWGFEASDSLLHLIWQLLAWDPNDRITAKEALRHPYFSAHAMVGTVLEAGEHNALESQMLDPRMDFNASDSISEFFCPKCGRMFRDWNSCRQHASSRKHGKFCEYDHSHLPSCLNAHAMLPAHSSSGYCDIQGRRTTIEDFHAILLLPSQQCYGIFDGHLGNLAAKYAASFLSREFYDRLNGTVFDSGIEPSWKDVAKSVATEAFEAAHENFLAVRKVVPHGFMDQSGSTATVLYVAFSRYVVASIGDTRAVLSSRYRNGDDVFYVPVPLTKDHVASDLGERRAVEGRGGVVLRHNGMDRVNGSLAITRSIGDAGLSHFLSREPHVIAMTKDEIRKACGLLDGMDDKRFPCFMILASDGLWDVIDNDDAVNLAADVILTSSRNSSRWRETNGLQRAAEALVHEAYVRGSTDNIGVCIIAIDNE